MTSKNKSTVKTKSASKKSSHDAVLGSFHASGPIDARKELLARVAGSIAAGLIAAPGEPSPAVTSASNIATVAVDIADEILMKAGIPVIEDPSSNDDIGAS